VLILFLSMSLFVTGWAAAAVVTKDGTPGPSGPPTAVDGIPSYYGKEHHGKKTANGEVFDMSKLTAAHRSLPFGSIVRVTNLCNHRSVIVRINDRGPYIAGRIIDLSQAAAHQLDMIPVGIVHVKVEVLEATRSGAS
jgi:rare lipoprotein A